MKASLALSCAITMIIGVLYPPSVSSQAAIGYAGAASSSTSMVAGASSRMRSAGTITSRQSLSRGAFKIPGPGSKNLETVMNENRAKLEGKSQSGGGMVKIESHPEKATVSVNGDPVGFAPMEIKLPEGKHLIELTHPRCDPWYMEVTVNAQESTSVTAKLERKYKSTVTISFE